MLMHLHLYIPSESLTQSSCVQIHKDRSFSVLLKVHRIDFPFVYQTSYEFVPRSIREIEYHYLLFHQMNSISVAFDRGMKKLAAKADEEPTYLAIFKN